MSQWCNTCSLGKVNGRYESCTKDCPAFGKTYEELAETVIRQREENDALRWTNNQLVKVEKEKRRELWKKAESDLVDKIASFFEEEENWIYLQGAWRVNQRSETLRSLLRDALKE